MNVGEKVKLTDEEGIFVIKQISGNKAVLLDSYGFETIILLDKLIPYVKYGTVYDGMTNVSTKKEDITEQKKIYFSKKKDEIREIDLHIGNIVDSLKNLEPHQMLEKQINKAREEIEKAKQDKVKKLILIHGKGKGVLKGEIYKLLNSIDNIDFFEADIIKYRFGAVEIRFK